MADVEKDIVLRVKSETDQAQGQFKSLKSELRSMEQQLQQMEASGQAGTEAFKQLQKQAGKVKDQIGDTKNSIKALSSDTFKLDAFAQAAQGIAGGFAAAQGAISLFGGENKAVEEAIKKTQGAMALLQGVTAITNILQKDSAFSLLFLGKAQKAVAVETEVATVATEGFGVALKAVGIGLITAALALLITYWDDVSNAVSKFLDKFSPVKDAIRDFLHTISFGLIDDASTAKTKANAEESLKALEKVANYNKSQENVYQRQIELAKARGKSLEEVFALENKLLDFRLKNNYAEQDAIKRKIALNTATEDEKKKLYELVESARDTIKEKDLLEINYFKDKKERQKRIEEAEMLRRKNAYSEIEEIETIKLEIESLDEAKQKYYENSASSLLQDALYYKKVADEQAEDDKRRHEKKIERAKQWLDISSEGLSVLMDLNEAFSKKDEASKKRAFERTKKLQIAQAIISTAQGVIGQLAVPQDQLSGINFAKAAIVLATGIAQVKKIQTTKYEGGGDALSSSLNAPDTSPSGGAMQTNTISSTQLQLDAQGNLKQQQIRTYVLETDISDKQKRSSRLQKTATFGR